MVSSQGCSCAIHVIWMSIHVSWCIKYDSKHELTKNPDHVIPIKKKH